MSCLTCKDGKRPMSRSEKQIYTKNEKYISGQYFVCNDGTLQYCYSNPSSFREACDVDNIMEQTDLPIDYKPRTSYRCSGY